MARGKPWKTGHIPWNKGLHGDTVSGINNGFFGKHHSEETKGIISKKAKGRLLGEKNPNYKPKIIKTCQICENPFKVKPSHNFQKCCSTKCMGIWRSQNLVGEKSPLSKPKIKLRCTECNKEIERNPYRAKANLKYGHFCSVQCQRKWRSKHIRGEKAVNWQGGIDSYPYCIKWTREFRERVRAYYGYVCIECGTPQFALKGKHKQLSVHHVNYDKDMCCNDKEPVFVCLCGSCNSKANGNKKGKSREWWQQHFTDIIMNYYGGKCYFTKEEMAAYTLL